MQEIELLAPGVDLNHPEKGRYYQNVYMKNGALTVRPGFGQLAQFDTTLGRAEDNHNNGYVKCLGTYAMQTNFGHTQLISVHLNTCYNSDSNLGGAWSSIYTVNIYDRTTDERWEEVVYRHTSERSKDVMDISQWHGAEESYDGQDYSSWQVADDNIIFFEEALDVLFFGSKTFGMHMYIPADFSGNRRKQINTTTTNDASAPYSESSIVLPVAPASGAYSDAYTYLDEATFPDPVDAAFMSGRLAIAREYAVYFSDIGRPASFIANNIVSVPSEHPITAVQSVSDNLLIFTKNEAFLYQPSTGNIVSGGRMNRLSDHVGCLGPNAITMSDNVAIWVDSNGAYMSAGGTDIRKISDAIQPFFDDRVSNPLTSRSEARTMANAQPRSNFDSNDMSEISMDYDHTTGCVFMSVPSQSIMLVFQRGVWFIWNFESVMEGSGTPAQVLAKNNITNAKVSATGGDVFIHCGVEYYTHTGGAKTGSFSILELGRGGALDRTIDALEDNRMGAGYYTMSGTSLARRFYIDAPVGEYYPVYLVTDNLGSSDNITNLTLVFTYDNTAFTLSPTMKLTTEVNPANISLGIAGNQATITYNNPVGMTVGRKNIMCWLRFTPNTEAKSLGITKVGTTAYTDTASGSGADLYWWTASSMTNKNANNNLVQNVDWVLKSGQLGAKDDAQVKLRTLYAKTKTHGNSTLKVQFASDWTDYKGQSADTISTSSNSASRSHELFGDTVSKWANNVMVDEEPYDTVASSLSIKGEHVSVMMYGSVSDKSERVIVDSARATYKPAGGRRRKGR